MSQASLTVLVDEEIKHDAEILFNKIGLNISSAINAFFRQALREQAMPFELKPYDDYYTGENLKRLQRSAAQSERGETISFTMDELTAMETGAVPQRALDFLAKYKDEASND